MKRVLVVLGLLALVPVVGTPAHAQSLDIESSLAARCLVSDCQRVEFFLELPGLGTVDAVDVYSHGGIWQFGSLVGVLDGNGKDIDVTWMAGSDPEAPLVSLWFSAYASPEPVRLIVDMQQWGTAHQVASFTYKGQGFSEEGHFVEFEGTAVPEPATFFMLLAGMIPMGIIVRRRRGVFASQRT